MSGLGSLFSGMSADNNDALKYSAPKEPKQRSAKPTPTPASPVVATVNVAPVATERPPGPSKIMASAAVRLFKVNATTGSYDAVEGGGLLGCVMMGTGLTFQILVYNAQKVPQATVAINATFDFTLRDLYMSFSDSLGNQWSLLFDSVDVMTIFVRTVVATSVHCATHNPDTINTTTIIRTLPSIQPIDTDTTLAIGMSVGVYITAWEIGVVGDYPGDVVTSVPYKTIQAPEEVVKFKLTTTDETIAGVSQAILGMHKGDRVLIGVSPSVFYTSSADSPLDPAQRIHPGTWVLLEVEIVKVKADKKKEKVRNSVPFDTDFTNTSTTNTSNNTSNANNTNNTSNNIHYDEQNNTSTNNNTSNTNNTTTNTTTNTSTNDIATRMARVAQGSGGGNQFAGIVNRSPTTHTDHQNKHYNNSNNSGNNNSNNSVGGGNGNSGSNNNSYTGGNSNQNQGRNNNSTNNSNTNNNYNSDGHSNDGNQHNYTPNNTNHNYSNNNQHNNYNNSNTNNTSNTNNNNNNYNTNTNNTNNNSQFENRVAVVEGQGVRSYYDTDDNNNNYNNSNNNSNSNNSDNYNQRYNNNNSSRSNYTNTNNNSANNTSNSNTNNTSNTSSDTLTATNLIQLHQSVAAVQQSMLQLHTKLDQVGTQVSNSAALQQSLVTTPTTTSSVGSGMVGGIQGINPYLNPLQQQMQLQHLQQQQLYYGGVGYSGSVGGISGGSVVSGGGGNTSVTAQRIKTEELVVSLQALLGEYERHTTSGSTSGSGAAEVAAAKEEAKSAARALRATIDKLEEKNDTLQTRYDKLMTEKSDLMEKYMEQFQTGSAAANKLYQTEQELHSLRTQHSTLQRDNDTLRTSSSGGSEKEQKSVIAELQHTVLTLQMQNMEYKQALDQAKNTTITSTELTTLQTQLTQQSTELHTLTTQNSTLQTQLNTLQTLNTTLTEDLERALLSTASATAQVAQYEYEERGNLDKIDELQTALNTAHSTINTLNTTINSLNDTISSTSNSGSDVRVVELQNEVTVLTDKLASSERTAVSLNQALDAVAAQAQATNDSTAATIADLQQQLTTLTNTSNTTTTSNTASADEVKNIMQEVYLKACEVFDPEAPDSAEVQYSTQDIVKRLRSVLKRVTTDRSTV